MSRRFCELAMIYQHFLDICIFFLSKGTIILKHILKEANDENESFI